MPQNGKYIFCRTHIRTHTRAHTLSFAVRSGYIIQAIRDGNADIVTSIPLEKENARGFRRMKKKTNERERNGGRAQRSKTLQTGVSGTDLSISLPVRFFFSFFFYPASHTRVFDNRRAPHSFVLLARSLNPLTASLFSVYPRGRFPRQPDLGKPSKTKSRWIHAVK